MATLFHINESLECRSALVEGGTVSVCRTFALSQHRMIPTFQLIYLILEEEFDLPFIENSDRLILQLHQTHSRRQLWNDRSV